MRMCIDETAKRAYMDIPRGSSMKEDRPHTGVVDGVKMVLHTRSLLEVGHGDDVSVRF